MANPPVRGRPSKWRSRETSEGFSLRTTGGGVLRAVVLAAILVVVASTVVYFTHLDERILQWAVNAGSFLVLGVSAFVTARREGRYGLLYGLAIGVGYAIVTSAIGAVLFPPFGGAIPFLKRLGFSALAGAFGGILGVNS